MRETRLISCTPHDSSELDRTVKSPCEYSRMATIMLNHLLSHHLATNQSIPSSINYISSTLETQRLIARTELEEGTNGPTLHRSVPFAVPLPFSQLILSRSPPVGNSVSSPS